VADGVSRLFDEYAVAWRRGERPDARAYMERAGSGRAELAELIDAFLSRALVPAPDEETVALVEAWAAGEPPLLALRVRRGLRREAVVEALLAALGLASGKRAKVARYYHELESGLLDPAGVSRSVFEALGETLRARAADLQSWRPRPPEAVAAAFLRAAEPAAAKPAAPAPAQPKEEWDEIDELFRGARPA